MSDQKEICCPHCGEKTITSDERLWAMHKTVVCKECGKELSDRISMGVASGTSLLIMILIKLLLPNIDLLWAVVIGMIPVIPLLIIASKIVPLKEHRI